MAGPSRRHTTPLPDGFGSPPAVGSTGWPHGITSPAAGNAVARSPRRLRLPRQTATQRRRWHCAGDHPHDLPSPVARIAENRRATNCPPVPWVEHADRVGTPDVSGPPRFRALSPAALTRTRSAYPIRGSISANASCRKIVSFRSGDSRSQTFLLVFDLSLAAVYTNRLSKMAYSLWNIRL